MFSTKEKGIKSEKGFTMIELIIVIAIMGILSAILVPSFTEMTRKSRLRADISTIQQVQAQINLYTAEQEGKFPGAEPETGIKPLTTAAVKDLVDNGYIKSTDTLDKKDEAIKLQTTNLPVLYSTELEHLILDVETLGGKIKESAGKLSASDKLWTNYDPTTTP